jgi:hypothetical protein
MNIKKVLIDFAATFALILVVAAIVTYLYSLIVHRAGTIDWETSFRLAIILGIVFPIHRAMAGRKKRIESRREGF